MNLFLIEQYIKRITKEDIYNYARSQKITLTPNELDTLYTYLKTYYKSFLRNPKIILDLLNELKSKVSIPVASKLDELYSQYKDKI